MLARSDHCFVCIRGDLRLVRTLRCFAATGVTFERASNVSKPRIRRDSEAAINQAAALQEYAVFFANSRAECTPPVRRGANYGRLTKVFRSAHLCEGRRRHDCRTNRDARAREVQVRPSPALRTYRLPAAIHTALRPTDRIVKPRVSPLKCGLCSCGCEPGNWRQVVATAALTDSIAHV